MNSIPNVVKSAAAAASFAFDHGRDGYSLDGGRGSTGGPRVCEAPMGRRAVDVRQRLAYA